MEKSFPALRRYLPVDTFCFVPGNILPKGAISCDVFIYRIHRPDVSRRQPAFYEKFNRVYVRIDDEACLCGNFTVPGKYTDRIGISDMYRTDAVFSSGISFYAIGDDSLFSWVQGEEKFFFVLRIKIVDVIDERNVMNGEETSVRDYQFDFRGLKPVTADNGVASGYLQGYGYDPGINK